MPASYLHYVPVSMRWYILFTLISPPLVVCLLQSKLFYPLFRWILVLMLFGGFLHAMYIVMYNRLEIMDVLERIEMPQSRRKTEKLTALMEKAETLFGEKQFTGRD